MSKKLLVVLLIIICITALSSCMSEYNDDNCGVTFKVKKGDEVSHTDGGTVVSLSGGEVKAVILVKDVLYQANEEYLSLYTPDTLNLHSGAYESNYNNYVYVSKLFEYLFEDNERDYSVYAIKEDELNQYPAWKCTFTSGEDTVCGYCYLTVERSRCVIVCIYVFDSMANIHKHDKTIDRFVNSFQIK